MASHVNELSINYQEEELLVVKELDKVVLSSGAWATVMFKYQQWDKAKQQYSPERYTIRRYRKVGDDYRQQSKFNISSNDQAKKIIDALTKWVNE
ncbi:MAG: hypothetical protein GF401_01250 [Chitinivibrionales bacterium]|nr:hypothetical protein [Chitinivibrionales bacterium]